jgi:hypothetical protein
MQSAERRGVVGNLRVVLQFRLCISSVDRVAHIFCLVTCREELTKGGYPYRDSYTESQSW